ncbi:hypothetical protein ACT7DG_00295 [Bacillus cereus]
MSTLGSIQYVHDPRAAEKWFDLYIECLHEKLMQDSSKVEGQVHIVSKKGR